MSESKPVQEMEQERQGQSLGQEDPVLGFLVGHNPIALENILEARERGFEVVLVSMCGESPVTRIAQRFGAKVLDVEGSPQQEGGLREILEGYANLRERGGLILHTDESARIDFDRSLEAYEPEETVTEAATLSEGPDIVVGIPAYNEAGTVGEVVSAAANYADEVIVVDDASSDTTASEALESGAAVVSHSENRGYGSALQTLFGEANERGANHLVILDGDGQHNPHDIPEFVRQQQESGAEILIGNRFLEGTKTDLPFYRRFGLTVVNTLTNLSMGILRRRSWIQDTQSGFRVYNRRAIESLSEDDSIGSKMSASTDILYHAHRHNYDVEEVPTTISYDVDDPSSHNPVAHGLTLVSNILRTIERERPILALGLPGTVCIIVGFTFGYLTISNYLTTDTFSVGFALVTALFALTGTFMTFSSIILHSLNAHLREFSDSSNQ
ncbi:glycosyltransferase family 2 protein [Halovivax limisalsi]|uniref:glycosyltransferase family 2 protein n=1 Tax=Halovivax limisalsi TaxID=1453760 RepID=UPI001FFC6EA0|nr:glycosyltransferase family 2 protein [Halovivax limisalsi]